MSNSSVYKPNLKGMIVGNGVTNNYLDSDQAYIDMSYWHSLIDKKTWDSMNKNECNYTLDARTEKPIYNLSQECVTAHQQYENATQNVNIYDILGYCWNSQESQEEENLGMKTYKK